MSEGEPPQLIGNGNGKPDQELPTVTKTAPPPPRKGPKPTTLLKLAQTSKTGDEDLDLRRPLASDRDFCTISVADTAEQDRFLDFVRDMQAFGSLLPQHLMALACAASGQGLDVEGLPVIGIAQRSPETLSLVALGRYLTEDDAGIIHVVEVRPGTIRSDMPGLLASFLKTELDAGRLAGDIVVIALPANVPTRELSAATVRAQDPLSLFLREAKKRAIVGFQLTENQRYSHFVNGDTRILPMPWAIPMLHAIAARYDFNPSRLDGHLVLRMEQIVTWFGPTCNDLEWQRSQQFAQFPPADAVDPDETQRALDEFLNRNDFDARAGKKRAAAIVDEALGLIPSSPDGAAAFPQGSRPIRQALLFTAGFCGELPGRYFIDLVRSTLDETATVEFSEMLPAEQAALRDLADLSGEERRKLPPTPRLVDYFRKHADRLCREYDIVTDDKGRMRPGKTWSGFAIDAHIGRNAPVAAADYANRLLANLGRLDFDIFLEQNTVIDVLASLRHHLASGFDDALLVAWLCERTFKPLAYMLAKIITENGEPDDEAQITHRLMQFLGETEKNSFALKTGWHLSETMTDFLGVLRDKTAGTGGGPARQEDRLIRAILQLGDWPANFRAAFSLGVIFQDRETPAGDYDFLIRYIEPLAAGEGRDLTFLRQVLSVFLSHADSKNGPDAAGAERALRVFEFLEALRKTGRARLLPLQDYFIEHILNFDIRWPPENSRLMSYAEIDIQPMTGHVMATPPGPDAPSHPRVETMLFADFFSVPPAEWLARSPDGIAATEADRRLLDTLYVLLDGVPEGARKWKALDRDEILTRLAQALSANCNIDRIDDLADYVKRVSDIPDSGVHTAAEKSLLDFYGLFQPAVLLHWRFNLFGVGPLDAGSADGAALKAFLGRLANAIPVERVRQIAAGLEIMERGMHNALTIWASSVGDREAHDFYAAKELAIRRMRRTLLAQAKLA